MSQFYGAEGHHLPDVSMSKTLSPALKTLLLTSQYLLAADLYTYTLADGTVLRYADCPQNIVVGANTFLCRCAAPFPGTSAARSGAPSGCRPKRSTSRCCTTRTRSCWAAALAHSPRPAGSTCALLKVDKLLTDDFNNTTRGVVNLFSGGIFDADAAGNRVEMKATTDLVFLNNQFPRRYLSRRATTRCSTRVASC